MQNNTQTWGLSNLEYFISVTNKIVCMFTFLLKKGITNNAYTNKYLFSVLKPQVSANRPRFEHIKSEELSMKMKFFSKKTVIFIIRNLFC